MEGVDAEVLISLVEAKPVLWDKTLEIYKDRNATRKAWEEVCLALNPDLENNGDGEKNAFGKEVLKRWTNLRDCFAKSKKDYKSAKKSGSGAKKRKKYVFSDQLQFLNKIYTEKETVDSLNPEIVPGTLEEDEEPEGTSGEPEVSTNVNLPSKPVGTRKRKKLDEVEVKILKPLEPTTPCSKMSFLQSLMPHLTNYSNSQFLKFQEGVLNVIDNINKLKETPHLQSNNSSSVPPYQPQPQYMLQPSTVNQPQAFVHVQQPPFKPRQYANPSFSDNFRNGEDSLAEKLEEYEGEPRSTEQNSDGDQSESGTSQNTTKEPPTKKQELEPVARQNQLLKLACDLLSTNTKEESNECLEIGRVWGTKLMSLDSMQRKFAEKAINDILFEADMGTLHRNSVQINSYSNLDPLGGH